MRAETRIGRSLFSEVSLTGQIPGGGKMLHQGKDQEEENNDENALRCRSGSKPGT
jgi:hypothetical protein